jgi:hypothetical protein
MRFFQRVRRFHRRTRLFFGGGLFLPLPGERPAGRVGRQRKIVLKAWKKRAGRKITFKNGRSSGIF